MNKFFLSGFLLLAVLTGQIAAVQAQQTSSGGFVPPPGGAPKTTVGGGSRPAESACLQNSTATTQKLTLLSPSNYIGLTKSDRPTVLIQLPPTTAKNLELSLFDQQIQGIYQTVIAVNSASGIMALQMPKTAPALLANKPYYWTVALVCNPSDRTEDLVAGAWIKYVEPSTDLKQQLIKATVVQRINLYAENGFWYEAIKKLVELQQAEPNSPALAQVWQNLL
ncbi:DUF928 domain-containing protein [Anabaena sp. UHCC 0451]|uniref:DUF928 domain-containing protein n=1 Tax=Anabaena sp. UHCC 0451 TaxID=2055235 RepID=UPI002B1FD39C|nr:DUF928 domain-containing protein [Anabaena sp. UHCC 0451]MEA5575681.1 DUF928 domain-containing protein [Anabaena sp. UHCC 0451]